MSPLTTTRVLACAIAMLMIVGACGTKAPGTVAPDPAALARVPRVTTANVLAAATVTPPPVVILLDEAGALHVTAIASWAALATQDPMKGARATDRASVARVLAEGRAKALSPTEIVEAFGRPYTPPPEPAAPPANQDEEEDEDDQDYTGVMIQFEEGKMGKKDSARAEGQYKMIKEPRTPAELAAVARRRAREEVYTVAGRRRPSRVGPPGDVAAAVNVVVGEVITDGEFERPAAGLLLAAPRVKATELVDALAASHARIAVAYDGAVRQLHIELLPDLEFGREPRRWLELRVGRTELAVEAVPEVPIVVEGPIVQPAFVAALAQARARRALDPQVRVDVLVEPTVDAQRVIDVLAALDQAGVRMIGLGRAPAPDSAEAKLRGVRRAALRFRRASVQGDVDARVIEATIFGRREELRACYTTALTTTPALAGTVSMQFFIQPGGAVAASNADGVDPVLASCVADVIKATPFPKPAHGGGAQVNDQITFEP